MKNIKWGFVGTALANFVLNVVLCLVFSIFGISFVPLIVNGIPQAQAANTFLLSVLLVPVALVIVSIVAHAFNKLQPLSPDELLYPAASIAVGQALGIGLAERISDAIETAEPTSDLQVYTRYTPTPAEQLRATDTAAKFMFKATRKEQVAKLVSYVLENRTLTHEVNEHRRARGFEPLPEYPL
jgi:hypothetical protein